MLIHMNINLLSLKHFGKFQNKRLELQDGINLVYGTNEAGKSTIHTFVRGMLFGIDKQRGRANFDTYTRYKPWDTPTLYDGEMEVEVEGVSYLIKRNFYKEEKSLQIINKETGREVPYKEQRGSCFIEGVTESNYSNTVHIAQQQAATGKELAFRINDYIANMSTTQTSEVNVNQAIKELQAQRKEIESKQTKQQVQELNMELKQIQTTDFMLKELERQTLSLDKEIQALTLEKANCKVDGAYVQKLQVLDSYTKEYDLIAEKYQSLKDCRDYYLQVTQQTRAWGSIGEQSKALQLGKTGQIQGNLQEEVKKIENAPRNHKGHIWKALFVILSCLICILVPTGKVNEAMIIVLTGVLVISIVLVQLLVNKERKIPNSEKDIPQENKSELEKQSEIQQQIPQDNQLAAEYKKTCEHLLARMQAQEKDILAYANKVVAIPEVNTETMKQLDEEITKLTSQLQKQKTVLQQRQMREKEVNRQIEAATTKKEKLRWEFSKLEESIADYAKKRAMRDELMERRKKEEVELTAIDISIQTIQELASSIHDDFGEKLNRAISEISTAFTLGNCYDVKVDEKLNMKIVKGSEYVSMEYLSAGTMEQLYLALRLVTAELLLKDREMPLILDDAFVYYDDNRLEETICKLATHTTQQILIFTCHNREQEVLDKHQIPYNYIEL